MSAAQNVATALRPDLQAVTDNVAGLCTGCGICVRECGFLKLYGNPRDIAKTYDPEDPKKNIICFECSLCNLCSAVCPENIDPKSLFLEMRREAVTRGHGLFPEHKGLLGYEKAGVSRRFSWYGLPEECTTIFFPGCALPGTRPAATMQVYELLSKQIPNLGLVMDCCTKPSHDLGRQDYFQQMFGEMTTWLESHGIQRILVACPNCYKVFSEYAPQFSTETIYEILAPQLPEAAAQRPDKTVTIHDPCVIRFNEAPQLAARRLVTGSGLMIEEMKHTRRTALCCGEGGTVSALAPDLAEQWVELRTEEASGRQVITYCAGCANHLGKRMNVRHVLDLICDTPKPSSGLITYLNRLRIKSRFKAVVPAIVTRERTINSDKSSGVLKPLLFMTIMIAAIIAVRMTGIGQFLEPDKLRALFAGFGIIAPLVYMAIYTIAPALMLPGLPISMAGATVFGPFWGVVYTIIGATMGACLAFLIARYGARDWVERRLTGSRWSKLDRETAQNGWKAVAFTRLIPLFPFNLLNFAFGLTKISFLQYAVATFIFMLPGTIAFITFSSSLLGLLKGNVSREFFIGILLIIAVSMIPKTVRWYNNQKLKPPRIKPAWDLKKSLRNKAITILSAGLLSLVAYKLIMKFFWALDAYLYTIEFNLLFMASRLRDADLAAYVEYLKPMSTVRASMMALVGQTMHTFLFPFSGLRTTVAYMTAFGTTAGALYSGCAALITTGLAGLCGRFVLGDLLPLYNRRRGVAPLTPPAAWTGLAVAAITAVPVFPLLFCGVMAGALRIPVTRSIIAISAGIAIRILFSVFIP